MKTIGKQQEFQYFTRKLLRDHELFKGGGKEEKTSIQTIT